MSGTREISVKILKNEISRRPARIVPNTRYLHVVSRSFTVGFQVLFLKKSDKGIENKKFTTAELVIFTFS